MKNIQTIEVELDAKVVIEWITGQYLMNIEHFLFDCRYLLGLFPRVKVSHCFREANQYVNKLIKNGATQ